MKPSKLEKAVLRIHFEDRSGTEFERLCFAYVCNTEKWLSVDWYGQLGGDHGRDIWGVKRSAEGQEISYCYQCANHKRLRFEKAKEDIDKIVDGRNGIPDHFILIVGGQVAASLKARIGAYAKSKGITYVQVWSGAEFEERLRRDAPALIRRFCEGESFPDSVTDVSSVYLREPSLEKVLTGERGLISWCTELILNDQFAVGDAAGAWSEKYPEYLEFVYGNRLPGDIGVRDTISYSTWIALALKRYVNTDLRPNEVLLINGRLRLLQEYLIRHYKNGGFGLTSRPKSVNPVDIDFDLRHTCWAMIALWELGVSDARVEKMLQRAGRRVLSEMDKLKPRKERAITYAVLHRLFSTDVLSHSLTLTERSRRQKLKRIESVLIDKFDPRSGTWDCEHDPLRRATIDNAFIVLYAMPAKHCVDSDCVETLKEAITGLCTSKLLKLKSGKSALPFHERGEADIGASLLLLYILTRDGDELGTLQHYRKGLLKFVTDPESRKSPGHFACPWYVASALHLV
jgi:hypothetical protein